MGRGSWKGGGEGGEERFDGCVWVGFAFDYDVVGVDVDGGGVGDFAGEACGVGVAGYVTYRDLYKI
jgi:hypothetical protein